MPWAGYSEKGQGSEERGPSTFTYQPPGVVQAQAGPDGQAVGVRAGVQGNSGVNSTYVPGVQDGTQDQTYKLLVRFGTEAIAKQAETAKNEQFLKGFTRAAQGEAMADILNEQPWYGKIFGDGPLVEGARAYTVESTASNWAAIQEQKMVEWKQHSPDKIPGMLAESMKGLMTGDTATDALIQQKTLSVMPQLIKRQTKEHYKHQQETASRARIDAITSQGTLLRYAQEATPGVYTPEEIEQRKTELLSVSTPTVGSDPEAWAKDLTTAMGILAEKGNFHAVNVYRDNGVLAKMDPEKRLQTERYINQFETKHASDATMQYVDQIAQIKEDAQNGVISAKQVRERYDAINNDYRLKSGNSQPVLRASTYITDERAAASAVIRNNRAHAEAVTAAGDFTQARVGLQPLFQTGGMSSLGGKAKSLGDAAFYQEWSENFMGVSKPLPGADGKPVNQMLHATKMLVVNANGDYVNDKVRDQLHMLVNSGDREVLTPQFLQAYQAWKAMDLAGGNAAKAKYFGEADTRMAQFDAALAGRDFNTPEGRAQAEVAYQTTLKSRQTKGSLSKPEKEELTKFVQAQRPGSWMNPWRADMTPQAQANIVAAMQPHYEQTKQFATGASATEQAFERAKARGLDVIGIHAVRQDHNLPKLHTYFLEGDNFIPKPEVDVAFNATLEATAKKQGIDLSAPYSIQRVTDEGGVPNYLVHQTDGFATKFGVISGTDIKTAHFKSIEDKRTQQKGIVYAPNYGPSGHVPRKPRMPSIGAPASAWDAYNKANAEYTALTKGK